MRGAERRVDSIAMVRAVILMAAAAALLPGCDAFAPPGQAKVDGILVPQAKGVHPAKDGPTLHLPGDDTTTLPNAPVIRLAIGRKVRWSEVDILLRRIIAADKEPVLLVGKRDRVYAFVLSDELEERESIALTATLDGKSCVSPPGVPEAKCVQPLDKDRIDRANTRRVVREAVREYRLTEVNVQVPPQLSWADVVRTIDAARTCCSGVTMRVKLNRK